VFLGGWALIFAMGRAGVYVTFCAPPLGFWGRIASLRFLILGYDQAWLRPLLGPIVSYGLAYIGFRYAGVSPLSISVPVALGLLIVLFSKPSFEEWLLTGALRLRTNPTAQAQQLFRT